MLLFSYPFVLCLPLLLPDFMACFDKRMGLGSIPKAGIPILPPNEQSPNEF